MGRANDHGHAGEALAASYLKLLGWRLLGQNVRMGGVEVDVVAQDGATTVLVEVKTRGRDDFGGAVAAIDAGKCGRLRRAAQAVGQRGVSRMRIDVVTVQLQPEGADVRHYRNAVQA